MKTDFENVVITREWWDAFTEVDKPNYVAMHFIDAVVRYMTGAVDQIPPEFNDDPERYQHYFDITEIDGNMIRLKDGNVQSC